MSSTLADIARETKTSISTVSRVLSGAAIAERFSKTTRQRIMQAAGKMGYRPNLLARSLRTRRTRTIAVLVSDIANPWFGQLSSLIEQNLRRAGYSVMICNSCEDAELEQEYLQLLAQKGIDGLIIVPLATRREELLQRLPEGLPVVVMDRPIPGIVSSITTDQQQAAELLCRQLEKIHVRRVALVRGPEHVFTHRLRAEAVRGRFKVVCEQEGPAQRETGRLGWLAAREKKVDAVVCTNNFLGQGVIEAMAEESHQPPGACFDEMPVIQLLGMPVVCCIQDVPQLAGGAVKLLLQNLEGNKLAEGIIVPAKVTWNKAFAQRVEG